MGCLEFCETVWWIGDANARIVIVISSFHSIVWALGKLHTYHAIYSCVLLNNVFYIFKEVSE